MTLRWLRLTVILISLNYALARPKDDDITAQRPLEISFPDRTNIATSPRVTEYSDRKVIEDLAVVSRASSDVPSLNPSVAKVTDQLIETIDQMVDKDVRTPPKLKEKIDAAHDINTTTVAPPLVDKVEANGKFQLTTDVSEGKASKKEEIIKGVAVPVIMDEDLQTPTKKLQKIPNPSKPPKEEAKKKVATTTPKPLKETLTTTPSSGLSTWILLSDNREATTPTPKNKKNTSTTTKKPNKSQSTTPKIITAKPANKKPTVKPEIKKAEPVSALEAMVNSQKKNTTRANQKKKNENPGMKENDDTKKVVTIPPAILVETTEISTTDPGNTEATVEATTKRKKTSSKKRKKNKNRRKKPAEKSGAEQEVKDVAKQPKQPVGAQLYNFLSREIMPTVGLGLVGVLVTAGLAGLLGYNPFVGTNIPVRRTYETQHGYSPSNNNYYSYNSEYGDSEGGQNEEVLFREVLSGMPDDSRYSIPNSDASYPEAQLYNSQEQAYDAAKSPGSQSDKKTESGGTDSNYPSSMYRDTYESYSNKESVSKYPVYAANGAAYPGYTERSSTTEKFKASAKYSNTGTIEKQPEALYRVSDDYPAEENSESKMDTETAWHRIGTPMDHGSHATHVEPGPRRMDLDKMTADIIQVSKRTKRSPESFIARLVRRSKEIPQLDNDQDNEIEVDDQVALKDATTASTTTTTTEIVGHTETPTLDITASDRPTIGEEDVLSESSNGSTEAPPENPPSLVDLVKRLAQLKLRLGLNFLKTTAEAFYRYLDGVQKSVEDSIANDTSFASMRNTWMGREAFISDDEIRVREKRFQRNAQFTELVNDSSELNDKNDKK